MAAPTPPQMGQRGHITLKAAPTPTKSADGKKTIFIASTSTADRADDVIDQNGWYLDNYLKNPVFLWAHEYDEPPVGKSVRTEVVDGALEIEVDWAPTPFAQEIKALYDGGYMNAVSVGFKILEWTYDVDRGGYTFTKVELLEVSAVPVPCNPEALAKAARMGISTKALEDWATGIFKGLGKSMTAEQKQDEQQQEPPVVPAQEEQQEQQATQTDEDGAAQVAQLGVDLEALELQTRSLLHRIAHAKTLLPTQTKQDETSAQDDPVAADDVQTEENNQDDTNDAADDDGGVVLYLI